MSKFGKTLTATSFALLLLVALFWASDIYHDQQYKVEVVKAAPLYALAPTDYPAINPVLLNLSVGSHLQVLRVRYGKDFEALKVETDDGKIGWVVGGDGVKVTSRGE